LWAAYYDFPFYFVCVSLENCYSDAKIVLRQNVQIFWAAKVAKLLGYHVASKAPLTSRLIITTNFFCCKLSHTNPLAAIAALTLLF